MQSSVSFRFVLIGLVSLSSAHRFLPDCSAAPERKGSISGRVTDNSGGVLQGAQIELQPRNVSLASNGQGEFFINDLEPGSYTLAVTYVGFKTFSTPVTVVAGQTANVEAKLEVESQNLQVLEVEVGMSTATTMTMSASLHKTRKALPIPSAAFANSSPAPAAKIFVPSASRNPTANCATRQRLAF